MKCFNMIVKSAFLPHVFSTKITGVVDSQSLAKVSLGKCIVSLCFNRFLLGIQLFRHSWQNSPTSLFPCLAVSHELVVVPLLCQGLCVCQDLVVLPLLCQGHSVRQEDSHLEKCSFNCAHMGKAHSFYVVKIATKSLKCSIKSLIAGLSCLCSLLGYLPIMWRLRLQSSTNFTWHWPQYPHLLSELPCLLSSSNVSLSNC